MHAQYNTNPYRIPVTWKFDEKYLMKGGYFCMELVNLKYILKLKLKREKDMKTWHV